MDAGPSFILWTVEGHAVWFELYVEEIGRAEAFYHAVAGWQFEPLDGMPTGATVRSPTPRTAPLAERSWQGFQIDAAQEP